MANLKSKYDPGPREWYEVKPVVYGFNIPKVRARLEWVMGSHIVQALDKGYQQMLLDMMSEDFALNIKKRNAERQKAEIAREKQLVLEGKMSMAEAMADIKKNPVIKINLKLEKIMSQKAKLEKPHVNVVYNYDYRLIHALIDLRGVQTTGYGETLVDVTSCYKILGVRTVEEDTEGLYKLTPEEYAILRYQNEEIEELNSLTHVNEMYRKADYILGYETHELHATFEDEDEEEEEEEEA